MLPPNIPEMTEQKRLPLFVKRRRLELSLGRTDAPGHGADGSPIQGGARLLTSPRALAPEAESKAEPGVEDPQVQHSGRSWRGAELVSRRGSALP